MMQRRSVWLCAVGVLAAAASARAGEVDKYLPDDTEMVVSFNVRQILDSDFYKNNVGDAGREALKNLGDAEQILKDLAFDPFKDLDRVIVAGPAGGGEDRGLVIVHGRFDLDKFRAKAEDAAKGYPDNLKIHKISDEQGGKFLVYEVTPNEQAAPVFVALADATTLLASPGKDYVVDAMRKVNAKGPPALKDKQMQALLEHVNDKQSVWVAVIGSALTEGASKEVKDVLEKVDAVAGGLTINDEIKIELAATAKDAGDAQKLVEDPSTRT